MSIFGDLREVHKGVPTSSADPLVNALESISSPYLAREGLANSVKPDGSPLQVDVLSADAPKSIEFRNVKSTYYIDQYTRASYYFTKCSINATAILRIAQEVLRNGLEWKPKFQCRCPRCGQTYERSTRKCTTCLYEGDMLEPDLSLQRLLVNWEGTPLMEKANRNGWTLQQLCQSFLVMLLVYNQPTILCKSKYLTDEHGNIIEEFPEEFVPVAPTRARMIFDETGEPGDKLGFCVTDRFATQDMTDPNFIDEMMRSGYYQNHHYIPVAWRVTEQDGGDAEGEGMCFADREIYHDTYMLPSINYGMPLCLLVESCIRAWIALELREEKYYATGHPPGVFVINNITPEATARVEQTMRVQMRNDPYTVPLIGIPPASDKVTSTKWHPFAIDPAESMIAVKQELLQRIVNIYGMQGIFLGDSESMRGNSNEAHQVAIFDRNLTTLRGKVNSFLRWVVGKYKYIGDDWEIRVREPPDNQAIDEAEKFNKQLLNAKLAKDLGFEIISQADGKIEISSTPQSYDPLGSLFGDGGGLEGDGFDQQNGNNPFNQSKSADSIFKDSLSKSEGGSDQLKRTTTSAKGQTLEQRVAEAILNGEVKVSDLYIHR